MSAHDAVARSGRDAVASSLREMGGPEGASPTPHVVSRVFGRSGARVWSWLTTVDHKRVGILYGVTAGAFFLIGGIEALLIRLQLARPLNTVVGAETFNALFTMHGTTMVFLAIMPLNAAFFNYMNPLMLGARDVAFPRLNALSHLIFLLGR